MRYATVAFLLALGASPISQASACGGFFCSSSPINQARETVVYGYEPDGSITMAVQITYSGRDEDFAWILPVPVAPDEIAVGTDALFQQLIAQTEPTFALQDAVEGQCARLACEYPGPGCSVGCGSAASPASSGGADAAAARFDGGASPGVVVHSEGVVGPYDTVVLSASTAPEVIEWLQMNGYDIPDASGELLGPYAEQGFVFVALRLNANRNSSVIRPVVMRLPTDEACLPIRLTPIASDPNLPIALFHLADRPARSTNYAHADVPLDFQLWTRGATWDTRVQARVQELGGRAFATDYAGTTPTLTLDLPDIADLETASPADFVQQLQLRGYPPGALLQEILARHIDPPSGIDSQRYLNCLASGSRCEEPSRYDPSGLVRALEDEILTPRREAQALVERHAYTTRLSTSMRPEDMTIDPVFALDDGLPDVPQVRTAVRVTECGDEEYFTTTAPIRLELPDGTVEQLREAGTTDPDVACRSMGASGARRSGGGCSAQSLSSGSALSWLAVLAAGLFVTWRRRKTQ
ncbi:MAG: DUF2330 domain-containing protein [Sandaracinaceae bacterium]